MLPCIRNELLKLYRLTIPQQGILNSCSEKYYTVVVYVCCIASQDSSAGAGGLVAAYGGGSESDEDIEDVIQEDRQHTNWAKLACLLCKRQFPTKESLIR
jgi:hypothetical protein